MPIIFRDSYIFRYGESLELGALGCRWGIKDYDIKLLTLNIFIFLASVPVVLVIGLLNNEYLPALLTKNDKVLHFGVFGIESVLFLNCFSKFKATIKPPHLSSFTVNYLHIFLVFCILFGAIGSEFLQNFINPKRSFDYFDMICNCTGSSLGYSLFKFFKQNRR
ncbi:hypothetical protein QEN19_003143 [Hanseniaspora menglaensis]